MNTGLGQVNPLPTPYNPDRICSAISQATGEQLFGTAPSTQVWFLLEVPEAPGAKALEESSLPQEVKDFLSELTINTPQSRLLFIRGRTAATGIRFFVGISREESPVLYCFNLADYTDLTRLDFSSILAEDPAHQANFHQEPIYLVCTNGKRDSCCARWGQPVFEQLIRLVEAEVWQSSHVAGHRFAANLVCLPHGIYYGRVRREVAEALIQAYQDRRIATSHYRGRSCYPAEAQAAEYFLRQGTENYDLDAFRVFRSDLVEPGIWEISFSHAQSGRQYSLTISGKPAAFECFESCTSNAPVHPTQYQLDYFTEK